MPYEVVLEQDVRLWKPATEPSVSKEEPKVVAEEHSRRHNKRCLTWIGSGELFNKKAPLTSIVETITYKSRVPWQKGRPAWLSDYALHFSTSRHFIARSLNGKPDYLNQNVSEGDRFNVFRQDKKIEFSLVVDTSRCKMWLYCTDKDAHETTMLKTYQVGLGRLDPSKASGLLTPLGQVQPRHQNRHLSSQNHGILQRKQNRDDHGFWDPFDPIRQGGCWDDSSCQGLCIHGSLGGQRQRILEADPSSIRQYKSDGCIRLSTEDMEELFAVITTRPTTIEIIRDFSEARR